LAAFSACFKGERRPLSCPLTAGAVRLVAGRSGMGEAKVKVNFRSLEIYSLDMTWFASFPVKALLLIADAVSRRRRLS
jgi:hypothetical protein